MAVDRNLGTFSPDEVIALITFEGTNHVIGGFGEGTFITAERLRPMSVLVTGVNRTGGRIIRDVKDSTVTFTLNSMSSSNDFLSGLMRIDEQRRDSTALFTLSIVDGTGRSWAYGKECFISNYPALEMSTEEAPVSWEITCNNLEMNHGGNAKVPPEIVEQLTAIGSTLPERWIQ